MNHSMIKTIERVGKALNESKIRWAIGGSVLLHMNGFSVEPNDLDIIYDTRDSKLALEVFASLGVKHVSDPIRHYQTGAFTEIVVDATEVDFMAGLKIIKDGKSYHYPFDESTPIDRHAIGNVTVPFMALEDWFVLYFLMPEKLWKASLIAEQFKKTGKFHPDRIIQLIRLMEIDPDHAEAIRALLR